MRVLLVTEILMPGMAAGADDNLTKPFSTEELIQAIEARLHRRQHAQEDGAELM